MRSFGQMKDMIISSGTVEQCKFDFGVRHCGLSRITVYTARKGIHLRRDKATVRGLLPSGREATVRYCGSFQVCLAQCTSVQERLVFDVCWTMYLCDN